VAAKPVASNPAPASKAKLNQVETKSEFKEITTEAAKAPKVVTKTSEAKPASTTPVTAPKIKLQQVETKKSDNSN